MEIINDTPSRMKSLGEIGRQQTPIKEMWDPSNTGDKDSYMGQKWTKGHGIKKPIDDEMEYEIWL